MNRQPYRVRVAAILAVLVASHFVVRPWLGPRYLVPDFLLLALMLYSIRSRPGAGAVAGFAVGLLGDTLVPRAFGAGALSYTVVGYLGAWGKAIFFADNLLVNAGFFFVGTWVRDLILFLASGHGLRWATLAEIFVWSPVKGLSTAILGVLVLLVFRGWLTVARTAP